MLNLRRIRELQTPLGEERTKHASSDVESWRESNDGVNVPQYKNAELIFASYDASARAWQSRKQTITRHQSSQAIFEDLVDQGVFALPIRVFKQLLRKLVLAGKPWIRNVRCKTRA